MFANIRVFENRVTQNKEYFETYKKGKNMVVIECFRTWAMFQNSLVYGIIEIFWKMTTFQNKPAVLWLLTEAFFAELFSLSECSTIHCNMVMSCTQEH